MNISFSNDSPNRPTSKTISYLHILFNDIGYTDNQAVIFCRSEFNRPSIKHLDDMTQEEASKVIERLKDIRRRIRGNFSSPRSSDTTSEYSSRSLSY